MADETLTHEERETLRGALHGFEGQKALRIIDAQATTLERVRNVQVHYTPLEGEHVKLDDLLAALGTAPERALLGTCHLPERFWGVDVLALIEAAEARCAELAELIKRASSIVNESFPMDSPESRLAADVRRALGGAAESKAKARLKHASRKDAATAVEGERIRTERMRMEITERAQDIRQLCRRIERLAQRRAL